LYFCIRLKIPSRELLKTDGDLHFLLILKKEELERLVACIRDRVDQTDSSFT
jgi:hypothetical protein